MSINKTFIIASHELKMVFREPQFLIPYILVPMFTIALYSFALSTGPVDPSLSDASSRLIILVVGVLITSMPLVLCADSFAGEKERNSLEILMCSPITLKSLFYGKLLGILPIPIILGWLGQLSIYLLSNVGGFSFISPVNALQLFLLTPLSAFFLCSVSVFISLRTQTVRSAAQLSGLVVLSFLFFMQFASTLFFENNLFAFGLLLSLLLLSLVVVATSAFKFEKLLYNGK